MSDLFGWINPLVGWLGLGGISIAGLLAVAWFFPPFRKIALAAAGVMFAALSIYTKGSRDATKRKQAEWDAAERKSVERGNKARADAERDVAAGRVRRDKFDRDDI